MIELQPHMLEGIPQNGPTDPIEYYKRPLIGRLFRERINRGLRMLPDKRYARVLEVGYGAGAVQLALASNVDELHGIDLDAEPSSVTQLLASRGVRSRLQQGSVYDLPYEGGYFDLIVTFSVFEHLHEYERALTEIYRVLTPGGLFLLGMPSVNKLMEAGFHAIGFGDINDHHVTTPAQVERACPRAGFKRVRSSFLDFPPRSPLHVRLYHTWLFEKPLGRLTPAP
jgi:ubiquinone/menaquinone biosynthesis C-methylase UbiE